MLRQCTQVVDALEINRLVDAQVEYMHQNEQKHVRYRARSRKVLKLIFSKTKPSSALQ